MKKYIFLFCFAISLLSHTKKPSSLNTLKPTTFQQESLMKLTSLYSCARYFNLNTQLKAMDWYAHLEQNIKKLLKETQTDKVDSLLLHQYQPFIYQLSFSKQALPTPQK
jgi:Na+-transporting NADH:ubiquinone oxidoreductase subunit NqrC